jgi:hypothetical protein
LGNSVDLRDVHRTSRETDVLDESRKEILVADVYPAIVVLARNVCVVRSDVLPLLDVDYFPSLGGD